ncbi:MAG: ATP-binding protein [Bacteroidia bacterium]|nr:ATP-binding protein [Bacteroidia bacterium]
MVLKTDIEQAWLAQKAYLKINKSDIVRNYLQKYKPEKGHIEVISGIRRCGKSTLMKQILSTCYTNASYFNFEDSRVYGFNVKDFQKLDEIMGKSRDAYFFDEIQNVASWEIFVRQLHDRGEKVYITGSNASLLSKELGTRLTGRHIRHELFPFSYLEFLLYKKMENDPRSLAIYLQNGGIPEYLASGNPEVLQNLLKDIVLRDIAIRYGIRNTGILMNMALFLVSNIGKEVTYNSMKKAFNVGSAGTVSDYLSWLEDCYLIFFLPRFSWSAKNSAVNPRKVYAVDNGLVTTNTLSFTKDKGRLLENAVYLFLRQKNYSLSYYREKRECDFVLFYQNKCQVLIQVCEQINQENMDRELSGVSEAMHFFDLKTGIIVTNNQKDNMEVDNKTIELVPAHEFFTTYII